MCFQRQVKPIATAAAVLSAPWCSSLVVGMVLPPPAGFPGVNIHEPGGIQHKSFPSAPFEAEAAGQEPGGA